MRCDANDTNSNTSSWLVFSAAARAEVDFGAFFAAARADVDFGAFPSTARAAASAAERAAADSGASLFSRLVDGCRSPLTPRIPKRDCALALVACALNIRAFEVANSITARPVCTARCHTSGKLP